MDVFFSQQVKCSWWWGKNHKSILHTLQLRTSWLQAFAEWLLTLTNAATVRSSVAHAGLKVLQQTILRIGRVFPVSSHHNAVI